jgi:hypothetical protein
LWPEKRIRQVLELSEASGVLVQRRVLQEAGGRWLGGLSIPVLDVTSLAEDAATPAKGGASGGSRHGSPATTLAVEGKLVASASALTAGWDAGAPVGLEMATVTLQKPPVGTTVVLALQSAARRAGASARAGEVPSHGCSLSTDAPPGLAPVPSPNWTPERATAKGTATAVELPAVVVLTAPGVGVALGDGAATAARAASKSQRSAAPSASE